MKPIILDYAITRTEEDSPRFFYDETLSLNVVRTKSGVIPFIDIDINIGELYSSTRVLRERDDKDNHLLELSTNTKVQRESDDNDFRFLELTTKTEVQREREDEHDCLIGLEISTKTLVNRERDDDDIISN